MRIRALSDLHREFGHVPLPEVAADVVVLAGDIDRGARGVAWARMAFPAVPVSRASARIVTAVVVGSGALLGLCSVANILLRDNEAFHHPLIPRGPRSGKFLMRAVFLRIPG